MKMREQVSQRFLWFSGVALWVAIYVTFPIVGVFASTVFELRLNEVGWVLGTFGLSMFIARPLIGLATSSWSQKKLAASGVLLVGLASIIVPLWPHPNTLIASRLMLGVGTGFLVSYVVFYVARSSHSGPKAMAQISTVHGVGSFISATLGGALVGWFGWFAPFWSGVVFSFFCRCRRRKRLLPASGWQTFLPYPKIQICLPYPFLCSWFFGWGLLLFGEDSTRTSPTKNLA